MDERRARWITRFDYPEVLAIEDQCFDHPWSERDLVDFLECGCVSLVLELRNYVLGYVVYHIEESGIYVLNLAVSPPAQRTGVGRRLLTELINRLQPGRLEYVETCVRERNLDAQLFFSRVGFRAVQVLRDWYEDSPGEAGYLFRYQPEGAPVCDAGIAARAQIRPH